MYGGDIDKKVLIQAMGGNGKVRNIEYVPHAAQGIRLFEFAAREDAMRQAACRHWVAAD